MRLEWDYAGGGRRPEWILEQHRSALLRRTIGMIKLTSPKRKRWTVWVRHRGVRWDEQPYKVLCYLDKLTETEALATARVLLQGYVDET